MGQNDETCNDKTRIDKVDVTDDKLTSRAGLTKWKPGKVFGI